MRGWVCPSPWECVSICFYVSVFKRLCLFYVAKGGRVRIQYSFRIFVCQLMPNKYHVLKKVQGTWTPIFFPVLSTDWREGELRGANEPMRSGRWIFHAICSLLLVLRYLESLYLSVIELNIFIHWLISLERSYLLSLNLCQHWGEKSSGIAPDQKMVSVNTWFSEEALSLN